LLQASRISFCGSFTTHEFESPKGKYNPVDLLGRSQKLCVEAAAISERRHANATRALESRFFSLRGAVLCCAFRVFCDIICSLVQNC
jgi:hypothetical protein